MELRHIRYFLAVAEEMNFTRAAEKLCIAQPPLSRQIRDLEEELQVELFVRKPHALQLTEEGILFRQYAMQIMNLVDRSTEEIHEIRGDLYGTLYLASVEGSAPRLLSGWIAGFEKLHPQVQYNLWNGNSDDVVNRVMKELCELAVIMEPHNAEGVEALPVFSEPWVAIIPKGHSLAQKVDSPLEVKELLPYDLIIPSRTSRLEEINKWFAGTGYLPTVRCRMAHMLTAYELTRQGVGISIYPATSGSLAGYPDVCVREIAEPAVTASYVLIWNKNHQLSHVAKEFVNYVTAQLPAVAEGNRVQAENRNGRC